jgi:hypothetical protein
VIYDEPCGLAQALRPEPGPVAVSRHDQQIRSGRRCHHGSFGMSVDLEFFTAAPEPGRRSGEQVTGRCGGQLVEPGPGIAARPATSPEQP